MLYDDDDLIIRDVEEEEEEEETYDDEDPDITDEIEVEVIMDEEDEMENQSILNRVHMFDDSYIEDTTNGKTRKKPIPKNLRKGYVND